MIKNPVRAHWFVSLMFLLGCAHVPATPIVTDNDYTRAENWLCRPGHQEACGGDLSATVIPADGKASREVWAENSQPPVDCFYVYPTVSREAAPNSDMKVTEEEKAAVRAQAARFASQCRIFAPLYRQATLAALRDTKSGPIPYDLMSEPKKLAYGDVRAAWQEYLAHDNAGRGFVLIGHSQGSSLLAKLLKEEIDGQPIQSQLISAIIPGINLPVPQGKLVGGAFKKIPLCHRPSETGCVIAYSSFRAETPPPSGSRFGKVSETGMVSACTNPAALGHSHDWLEPYFPSMGKLPTAFLTFPKFLRAKCVNRDGYSYLAIRTHHGPGETRPDIKGEIVFNGKTLTDWGLHLIDVNVALGNLVKIVESQSKAYLGLGAKR